MRHSFSAEYLKILPPASNFGEAWENLCFTLLREETRDDSMMRFAPPDRGIDIYRRDVAFAYQCKSSERGIFGTIDAEQCIASLSKGIATRKDIGWQRYHLALNAPLTGVAFSKIKEFASLNGLTSDALEFLLPDYWDGLCERHRSSIESLFDYRVFVTETQVIEALRKARYYDSFVQRAITHFRTAPLQVRVSNNRTPIELILPFSGEMTVGQLFDVVHAIFGIPLDWANFPDLETSCGPSLTLTIDRVRALNLKLAELTEEQRAKLQFWIQLIWEDKTQTQRGHFDGTRLFFRISNFHLSVPELKALSISERSEKTLGRMEAIIQELMWQAASRLKADQRASC